MMFFLQYVIRRTFQNMMGNLFSNLITIGIIAISMLIFSTFTLLAFNLTNFLKIWEDKIEVIAYLKRGTPSSEVEPLLKKTRLLEGVETVRYVSPYDAMGFMETKLGGQKNLLEGIQPAVLPPSFEIQMKKDYRNSTKIKEVVAHLKEIPQFEEIQYGQEWVETFSVLVHILRLTQWILGGLLLIAVVFITSNTLQLTISSRREEIEVMHWVGTSPSFIRIPFYLEGLIQGFLGGGLAILFLFLLHQGLFLYIPPSMQAWLAKIPVLFLPLETIAWILLGGMVLGFFGSFVASMRVLKYK
ncbi:MAG: ABC transporter permease [Deltaproteobacteria bacterium CG_4_8_14_3_um_filter_45_9]|nr:MAG: ABC transporter permease [Deltaproteobacteria bacterium CG03_land_8_20_14_0_80_45_14]PIX21542.1 MAG: ABC transporter permease [Deltaproteobacteria bacterium CG_4_8_14_3_um_filter_45_9]